MRERRNDPRPGRPAQASGLNPRKGSAPAPASTASRRKVVEQPRPRAKQAPQPARRDPRPPSRIPSATERSKAADRDREARTARVVDLGEHRRARQVERRAVQRPVPEKTQRTRLDPLGMSLIGVVSVLACFGMVMIYTSSSNLAYLEYGSSFYFLERQAIAAAIGLVLMIGLARHDYHQLENYAPLLLIVGIVMLFMCFIPSMSVETFGSRRFLRFGIQPSEFMKLALILFVAANLSRRDRDVRDVFDLLNPTLAVTGLVLLLIILEPDMGTTVIIACTVMVMMVVAEARWVHLFSMALLGVFASAALILYEPYRFQRLFAFLDPWGDPQGGGFHIIQSMLAMGSGHVYGLGLGMSRQKFMYLPNAHNDFIFSIIGEEAGFIGTMFVVTLFVSLILIGVKIARRAPDPMGKQIAIGITFLIGAQAFVNMGAVTGILPITGVTLPFISYGGSSLVIFMSLIGILISVATRERVAIQRKDKESETNAHSDMWGRNRRASVSSSRARGRAPGA